MGGRWAGDPGSVILGYRKGLCVVNFYFISVIVFFEIFHSKLNRPDGQIHCLIFLVLDYMLFLKSTFIY